MIENAIKLGAVLRCIGCGRLRAEEFNVNADRPVWREYQIMAELLVDQAERDGWQLDPMERNMAMCGWCVIELKQKERMRK